MSDGAREDDDTTSTESLNAALESIGEGPMPVEEGAPTVEPAAAEQQTWNGEEWKFDWNGKQIVPESRDKIKTWMQQGYNYSQRMGELNKTHAQRMAEAEQRLKTAAEMEERFSPFAKVDEYAQKNKDWWNFVQQSYEQRLAQDRGIDPNLAQVLNPLQEKLTALEQDLQQRRELEEQQKQAAVEHQEDEALDAEIGEIRKEFPNIDLSARDETGETLEARICKHGIDSKIHSFRAAFRDYLFPQLVNQQKAQTAQQGVKAQQAQAKAGILGKTPAPVREVKRVSGKLGWNHPDVSVEAALAEWHQSNGG